MAAKTPQSGDAHAAAAAEGLPQFDISTFSSQITWLVITFGILYIVLWRFILPRLGNPISERKNRVADDLDTASRMQREAEEAQKAYEQLLVDAKAKAHNMSEATRSSVNAEIDAEIEAADAEAAQQAIISEAKIQDIRKAALANIDTVASDVAADIVKKFKGKTA
ncbi:MAG: F0F1 ATP synthase subunit B' [Maricaulaceae bacterium]